jgi:hypothetical protein
VIELRAAMDSYNAVVRWSTAVPPLTTPRHPPRGSCCGRGFRGGRRPYIACYVFSRGGGLGAFPFPLSILPPGFLKKGLFLCVSGARSRATPGDGGRRERGKEGLGAGRGVQVRFSGLASLSLSFLASGLPSQPRYVFSRSTTIFLSSGFRWTPRLKCTPLTLPVT